MLSEEARSIQIVAAVFMQALVCVPLKVCVYVCVCDTLHRTQHGSISTPPQSPEAAERSAAVVSVASDLVGQSDVRLLMAFQRTTLWKSRYVCERFERLAFCFDSVLSQSAASERTQIQLIRV